jgi:H+/gluconate symporter-like permease
MLGFGLWWLMRAERAARLAGEGFGEAGGTIEAASQDPYVRERATTSGAFDPAELQHGHRSIERPGVLVASLPLMIVVLVNLTMSMLVIPRLDTSFLAEPQWGGITIASVSGIWSVMVALIVAILVLVALNRKRLSELRASVDAGANASVLPIISVASLVGFGAVVAALPAFTTVADWVLSIEGGPLVSLAMSINILAALTGSASGGMTIALDALGPVYLEIASQQGIDPALLHRIAVISAGTLDSLPHNGAVITLLAVCGSTHRKSYIDILMCCVVSALLALVAVIVLGGMFGSF